VTRALPAVDVRGGSPRKSTQNAATRCTIQKLAMPPMA
jgi:hypothetical protein